MINFIENIKNSIDFFIREKVSFSRKNYTERSEPKENIFGDNKLLLREQELVEKYNLQVYKQNSSVQNYLENLYTLDVLDNFFEIEQKKHLRVLDIGCKNWFYSNGEHHFFKNYCNELALDGVELDYNRLYTNFYTRAEVAKFYIKDLKNTKYIKGNFLKVSQKYDVLVWFLPFIFVEPLLKWGLPTQFFGPKEMLMHAFERLNDDGKIFVVNQGAAEYIEQQKLCDNLGLKYQLIGEISSGFFDYGQRFALIIYK